MSDEIYEKGLVVRKEVIGEEYVNASLANADDFSMPIQVLATKYCWGEIWSREGLPRKTRSLINIAMITVLNRPHELKMHILGALRNQCTKVEIREVLLQTAAYCGLPAAIDSFRIAREAFAEADAKAGSDANHP